MRKIALNLTHLPGDVPSECINKAIGYLSTWNMKYPEVEIFQEVGHSKNLMAVYRNGNSEYVIAAIWRSELERYTYH